MDLVKNLPNKIQTLKIIHMVKFTNVTVKAASICNGTAVFDLQIKTRLCLTAHCLASANVVLSIKEQHFTYLVRKKTHSYGWIMEVLHISILHLVVTLC